MIKALITPEGEKYREEKNKTESYDRMTKVREGFFEVTQAET